MLFSQPKITGSFHTAAKLSASWKAPILVVPSPKKQTETSSWPLYCARSAAPQAIGRGAGIGEEREVPGLHGDGKARRHRLLAEREMARAFDEVLQEQVERPLLGL